MRLNSEPPAEATYFDPSMLVCSPCQSGAVNRCKTVVRQREGGGQGNDGEGKFDWLYDSQRTVAAAAASKVSDCCTTELDPNSGLYKTTCDTAQGCGWVAGPFLTENVSCKFATTGATYASFDECQADNVAPAPVADPQNGKWFPPCGPGQVTNCYYPNLDACLPANFGKQKIAAPAPAPAQHECSAYVCDAAYASIDAEGRMSFPGSSCRCVTK